MNALTKIPLVRISGDHPTTTTLIIAEHFGKKHKDVLKSLRAIECDEEFRRRNFAPSEYINQQGRSQPMCELTRDGFMLLVMGFTGAEATRIKIAFIEEFNRLEALMRTVETLSPKPSLATVPVQDYVKLQRELIGTQRQLLTAHRKLLAHAEKDAARLRQSMLFS